MSNNAAQQRRRRARKRRVITLPANLPKRRTRPLSGWHIGKRRIGRL